MIGATGKMVKPRVHILWRKHYKPAFLAGDWNARQRFSWKLGDAGLTTPDAITLQTQLRHFVEQGAQAVRWVSRTVFIKVV